MSTIRRRQLFTAACISLLVTSLSFGIRAGILGDLGTQFHLSASELAIIASTAFWGFPLAIIVGGMLVDIIGMKRLLITAFLLHFLGIMLTIFATGFSSLFISTLFIGLGNGTVEAACNPLVTSLYPEDKTTRLNYFHLWFPGGIVIGSLLVFFTKNMSIGGIDIWKLQVGIMFIPTIIYGYLFSKLQFPVTERVAAGVSTRDMYKALANPLFIVMIILMFGTAITELFTGQWIDILLRNVTGNAILLLAIDTGVMVIGRAFAGPVVHRLAPQGVLLMSAIFAALGLYMLGHYEGSMLYIGALVFGIGVCYFWPTMLGFVSENLPRTGAVGLNLMGGAGMFAVSVYMIFMGGYYDELVAKNLPGGADIAVYTGAAATPEMVNAVNAAKASAGPDIINVTLTIPVVLIAALIGLNMYMRKRRKTSLQSAVA